MNSAGDGGIVLQVWPTMISNDSEKDKEGEDERGREIKRERKRGKNRVGRRGGRSAYSERLSWL